MGGGKIRMHGQEGCEMSVMKGTRRFFIPFQLLYNPVGIDNLLVLIRAWRRRPSALPSNIL